MKNDYKDFSSPYRWEMVLDYLDQNGEKPFRKLRLNLAHFGGVDSPDWRRKITDMILERDSENGRYKYENFYTDI